MKIEFSKIDEWDSITDPDLTRKQFLDELHSELKMVVHLC